MMKSSSSFLLAAALVLSFLSVATSRDASAQGISLPYPDMLVGKSLDSGAFVGDNIFNSTGFQQRIRVRKQRRATRVFFTCQNDTFGNDTFRIRAKRGNRRMKVRYHQLVGGDRRNVTGQVITNNFEVDLFSTASVLFQARATTKRPRAGRAIWMQAYSPRYETEDRAVARIVLMPGR